MVAHDIARFWKTICEIENIFYSNSVVETLKDGVDQLQHEVL